MRIGIIGAGVGGLTLALSLIKKGFRDINVYEASEQINELGVGINVLPHAMRVMDELNLLEELVKNSVETNNLKYFTKNGQLILTDKRGKNAGYQWPQISIHRSHLITILHQALSARLGKDRIHTNHRFTHFARNPDHSITAFFANKTEEFDLLIGCDGIHSVVRKALYPGEGAPKWDGITMWRAVSYMPASEMYESMIIAGKSEHRMVIYPIEKKSNGHYLINWVAKHKTDNAQAMPKQDWVHKVDKHEIPEYFENYGFLEISELISNAQAIYKYPQVDRDPLPTWNFQNITLLGDAAHPMYPSGSNGASQAILDAESLARYLRSEDSISLGIEKYDADRRTATTEIVLKNRKAGPERCIDVVETRAPEGFYRIEDVISNHELQSILSDYKKAAGFDRTTLSQVNKTQIA